MISVPVRLFQSLADSLSVSFSLFHAQKKNVSSDLAQLAFPSPDRRSRAFT